MMYKTIYRFRVRVEEKSLSFPLHICIYQDKAPQFEELLDKMRHAASLEDLCINDYYITVNNNNNNDDNNDLSESNKSCDILHDDHSLRRALKQMSERHYLELILQRKRARTLSPPLLRRESLPMFPQQSPDDIPVIKPTVLRWSSPTTAPVPAGAVHPTEMRPAFSYHHDDQSYSARKDSGVSFCDEPIMKKKQRAVSADDLRARKLPDLYHPYYSPPRRHNSLFDTTTTMTPPTTSSSSSVHPLELRRPSAINSHHHYHQAPPSPPYPKLPTIASLTHNMAPIDQHLLRSPPQTPSSPASSCSSAPVAPTAVATVPPVAITATNTTTHSGRRASSIKSSSRTPGQFLCEHVVDPTSRRICGQTFRRSYDLSRHQSIHMKNRPFCYCNQCGKKFTRMDALRRHERVQGHIASKRYHASAGQSV